MSDTTTEFEVSSKGQVAELAVLGFLAAAGVGYAAIPSADGVIHSCYGMGAEARCA